MTIAVTLKTKEIIKKNKARKKKHKHHDKYQLPVVKKKKLSFAIQPSVLWGCLALFAMLNIERMNPFHACRDTITFAGKGAHQQRRFALGRRASSWEHLVNFHPHQGGTC